jgi:hypothetical protein
MAAFGERAFLLLRQDDSLAGLAGWQVENLVARTSEVYLEPGLPYGEAMRLMMEEIERASNDLLCEASLVFLPPHLARNESVWKAGYEIRQIRSPGVRLGGFARINAGGLYCSSSNCAGPGPAPGLAAADGLPAVYRYHI